MILTAASPFARDLPAGRYRARVARSYGSPGRIRLATETGTVAAWNVGKRGTPADQLFDFDAASPLILLADDADVDAAVELTRIGTLQ